VFLTNDTCSSDDDIDTILHSTSEHRRRPKRLHELREEESSSEDEFEKEMASELNAKMKKIERQWTTGRSVTCYNCTVFFVRAYFSAL